MRAGAVDPMRPVSCARIVLPRYKWSKNKEKRARERNVNERCPSAAQRARETARDCEGTHTRLRLAARVEIGSARANLLMRIEIARECSRGSRSTQKRWNLERTDETGRELAYLAMSRFGRLLVPPVDSPYPRAIPLLVTTR